MSLGMPRRPAAVPARPLAGRAGAGASRSIMCSPMSRPRRAARNTMTPSSGDDDHHQQGDPVLVEVGPRAVQPGRGDQVDQHQAQVHGGRHRHRPGPPAQRELPGGTQPRARAIIEPITVSSNDR